MNHSFHIIQPSEQVWDAMYAAPDNSIFFTQQWDKYLKHMGIHSIIIEVHLEDNTVGYFVGSRRWVGFNTVLARSMGTGTYSQGLCMLTQTTQEERIKIYQQLSQYLSQTLRINYLQICDYQLKDTENKSNIPALDAAGVHYNPRNTFVIDLRPDEDVLWKNLHYKSCKYCINKARKEGLTIRRIESIDEIAGFARRHSSHLRDMMRRKHSKGLPCQRHKNILALCQSLFPNHVLMLETVTSSGLSIASGIFAYTPGGTATYYTAASLEEFMYLCPNELLVWEAMCSLHSKGVTDLILGGVAHYKKKYAPKLAYVPVLIFSRYSILLNVRKNIKELYQHIMYRKNKQ